jgi:transposase-like protein
MGQVRHGSATTTHAVTAAIQRSQASLAQLSQELGINPKTVAKWRKRASVEDMKTGPTEPRSTVLTEAPPPLYASLSTSCFRKSSTQQAASGSTRGWDPTHQLRVTTFILPFGTYRATRYPARMPATAEYTIFTPSAVWALLGWRR